MSTQTKAGRNGFPRMSACSSSEFKTMKNSTEALRKYEISSSIVFASRGPSSLGNLTKLQKQKLGSLMAQKISHFNESLKKKMLHRSGYTLLTQLTLQSAAI